MLRYFAKSALLLGIGVVIFCGVYPGVLWLIGQTVFPYQANGSIVRGDDGKVIGSMLVAQPFTKDEYFQPRPSAASYDATASTSSGFGASNYALRDRVARALGPIVTYASGDKKGQPVAPDVEACFRADKAGGDPRIVAQWADAHNSVAQGWVTADPTHGAYVDAWTKAHDDIVKDQEESGHSAAAGQGPRRCLLRDLLK
jgi:potassium-transporting ATPase KdpC subunit